MSKLISLAVFDNVFDVKYNLLKDMLDEAGIAYITSNENTRIIKPALFTTPANVAINIKVYEDRLEEALTILRSIL